jgi:alpha/beta superfamily hydrolase
MSIMVMMILFIGIVCIRVCVTDLFLLGYSFGCWIAVVVGIIRRVHWLSALIVLAFTTKAINTHFFQF